jgi:hypothetical protein
MCNGKCKSCSMKPRAHWGDMCMTDTENTALTDRYLANLAQAGVDWEAGMAADAFQYEQDCIAEGLPLPVREAMVEEMSIEWR